jgi:hypothetical protein
VGSVVQDIRALVAGFASPTFRHVNRLLNEADTDDTFLLGLVILLVQGLFLILHRTVSERLFVLMFFYQ